MAAGDPITDLSDLINLTTGGGSGAPEQINFHKRALRLGATAGTFVSGAQHSLWLYDGSPGSASAAPTTAAACTNATAGALGQTTSASGAKKRLLSVVTVSDASGSLILYDRLSHQGGLSGTTTGAQTTNLPTAALTRRTSGVGVELWLEISSIIGTTATTVTASYTDDAGNTGNTTAASTWGGTGFREVDRIIPLGLASGDKGVRAVASVTNAATTGTAGAFGVTLLYPLVVLRTQLGLLSSTEMSASFFSAIMTTGGPLDLGATSDACLAWMWQPVSTAASKHMGVLYFVEK